VRRRRRLAVLLVLGTLPAVTGFAACGGGSHPTTAPSTTSTTRSPATASAPTASAPASGAQADLAGATSALAGAQHAIGASDPNAAQATEGTAP